jgi:hypothetical protein
MPHLQTELVGHLLLRSRCVDDGGVCLHYYFNLDWISVEGTRARRGSSEHMGSPYYT